MHDVRRDVPRTTIGSALPIQSEHSVSLATVTVPRQSITSRVLDPEFFVTHAQECFVTELLVVSMNSFVTSHRTVASQDVSVSENARSFSHIHRIVPYSKIKFHLSH